MTDTPLHEVLRRIFAVIIEEAEHNPRLAQRLVEAAGQDLDVCIARRPRSARKTFDASEVHAINILRQHGEAALRGRLDQVRAVEDLKSIATASGLVLSASVLKARPSRGELIAAIVAAAKHYDAQRSAAAR